MKIETSTVQKITIKEVPNLDPITCYIEDYGEGQGKLTVECWGSTWSTFWDSMGDRHNVVSFVNRCNASYLLGRLDPDPLSPKDVPDPTKYPAFIRAEIIKRRREKELDEFDAREFYDAAGDIRKIEGNESYLARVFGDEWFYTEFPTKPSREYDYLCRVVNAIKIAFIQLPALSPAQ